MTNSVILFKNTISPHAHTQPSLYKIFTLADFKNKKPKTNSSIIQLANLGGYTTYWISNQRPIGVDETIPTILSNAAHSSKFIATDNYNSLDGQLLPEIDKVLTHKNQKKVIFIHLMGSHFNYSSRYPRRFNYFNDSIPPYNENKNNTHKYINNYDNAVRYTDFVIYNILKKIKKKQISSTLTYFSDHGEDVFRTIDFFGHSEYYCSRPMLDVPYFFWASEKFKTTFPSFFKNPAIINRKYSLEDYYHTFAETCGIKFNDFDPQKSIFNPKFCERERLIKKGINYDQR